MQAFGRQESTHQLGMCSYHRSLANRMIPGLTNLCHLFPFVHLVGFKHHHLRIVLYILLGIPQCSSPFSTLELPTHNTEVSSLQFGPTFSSAEVRRYRVRLEEGYDLHDNTYAQWLSTLPTLHCNSATEDHGSSSKSGFAPNQLSTLEKILHVPTPPAQRKSTKYAKSDRVLTSEECMREAKEKEERKKQKEEDK